MTLNVQEEVLLEILYVLKRNFSYKKIEKKCIMKIEEGLNFNIEILGLFKK